MPDLVMCRLLLLLLSLLAHAAVAATTPMFSHSAEPTLTVEFGADSAGELRAGLMAVEPGITRSRLQVQLSSDTPVLIGLSAAKQSSGTLQLLGTNASATGEDFIGSYTETALLWGIIAPDSLPGPQPQQLRTAARHYANNPRVVVFESCVVGAPLLETNHSASSLPVIGFPSVQFSSVEQLGYAYWHGLWPDPVVGLNLSDPLQGRPNYHDGPMVFSAHEARAEGAGRLSILIGPLSDPLTTVFGATHDSLYFGPSARVQSLPSGYCYTTVAVLGDGVTDTVKRYGELLQLQASASSVQPKKLADPNLRSLSAWTDNGAFYFWNAFGTKVLPPPAAVLPQWLASLRKQGVNVSTLQLDGWWMAQLNSTPSPKLWPGDDWSHFLREINQDQVTQLLLYKAFFSGGYDLFEQLGCTAVVSPQGAHYPAPNCSRPFYAGLFKAFKRIAPTFAAYETDFLSDHLLPTPGLAGEVGGLTEFFGGLAQAAAEAGLPVQLCMPTAGVVLASAGWPAMTNGRVSTDYATQSTPNSTWAKTYNIGIGSLLFWAVDLAPSKDVTWTVPHQPGGGFQYDQPNVELDYVLAVLSSGPVGIGDGIGFTNASLATMGANRAGVILRADKPLTAIDSTFIPPTTVQSARDHGSRFRSEVSTERPIVGFLPLMPGTKGCTAAQVAGEPYPASCQPAAEQTHTLIPLERGYATRLGLHATNMGPVGAAWRILVSLHLGDFDPPRRDLLPIPQQHLFEPKIYRELRWSRCTDNTQRAQLYQPGGCLKWLSQQPDRLGLNIKSGDRAPTTLADSGPVPWRMFTLFPRLPETATDDSRAWTLIGEVDKIVSVSALRFLSVGVTEVTESSSCLVFGLVVEAGEVVKVGAITPNGTYVESAFGTSGSQRLCE